ncbi:MAG: hypothetical protein ABI687_04225 [Flavitalea sp.]
MKKYLPLLFLFASLTLATFSQTNSQIQKECRISSGFGFAGATNNLKTPGTDIWIQLDYKLLQNISIATEFENMTYKQPGYYIDLPVEPNEIKVYNNNFSLLIKYHFIKNKKITIAVASGWTFSTRQNEYYIYENDGTSQHWFLNVSSFSDYRIPFIVENAYAVSKKINLLARLKYNLNPQNGDTYSGGLGLSIKL